MKLLGTTEVAKRLKVTPRRVVAMIASGKIKAERVGRDYIIEEGALEGIKPWGRIGRPPWKKKRSRLRNESRILTVKECGRNFNPWLTSRLYSCCRQLQRWQPP